MATIPTIIDDHEQAHHPDEPMSESEFVDWCLGFEKVRAEWVDGEVVVMSPVSLGHNRLAIFLLGVTSILAERQGVGEVFGTEFACRFRSGPRLLRRVPDIQFVVKERLHLLQPTYFDGAPDLALEIVSLDSSDRDHRIKFEEYQAAGVREYWIVDPLVKALHAYRLDPRAGRFQAIVAADGRMTSDVLPGFGLRPEWLWREPLPRVSDVVGERDV